MFSLKDSALTLSQVAVLPRWLSIFHWYRGKSSEDRKLGGMVYKYKHKVPSQVGVPVF